MRGSHMQDVPAQRSQAGFDGSGGMRGRGRVFCALRCVRHRRYGGSRGTTSSKSQGPEKRGADHT